MLKAGLIALALVATAAIAQAPTDTNPASEPTPATSLTKVEVNGDPDQIVCVNQGEIGTRLARRRICRTRAEWAEHHDQSRQVVEKVQYYKPTCPGNGRC